MWHHLLLRGDKVTLRPVQAFDLVKIMAWDEDDAVVKLIGKKFENFQSCREWFTRVFAERTHRALAVDTAAGEFIGNIELDHINWRDGSAELSICIGEKEYWNHGYGTDAILVLLGHAFRHMRLSSVYLRVYRHNGRAIRCYEKCGFEKEALLCTSKRQEGRDGDVILMHVTRAVFLGRQPRHLRETRIG